MGAAIARIVVCGSEELEQKMRTVIREHCGCGASRRGQLAQLRKDQQRRVREPSQGHGRKERPEFSRHDWAAESLQQWQGKAIQSASMNNKCIMSRRRQRAWRPRSRLSACTASRPRICVCP